MMWPIEVAASGRQTQSVTSSGFGDWSLSVAALPVGRARVAA
jgi:hypothetical protein